MKQLAAAEGMGAAPCREHPSCSRTRGILECKINRARPRGASMYATWLSAASVVIALGSLLYNRRNTRTGKQSLDVASVLGQVNYENARANYTPAATLTLTEVEFRPPTALEGGLLQSEA
ncbi:hypothetical protein [Amycolatopsis lurida]|nr:hypothetical protein [Amycolatopsis lurida]